MASPCGVGAQEPRRKGKALHEAGVPCRALPGPLGLHTGALAHLSSLPPSSACPESWPLPCCSASGVAFLSRARVQSARLECYPQDDCPGLYAAR